MTDIYNEINNIFTIYLKQKINEYESPVSYVGKLKLKLLLLKNSSIKIVDDNIKLKLLIVFIPENELKSLQIKRNDFEKIYTYYVSNKTTEELDEYLYKILKFKKKNSQYDYSPEFYLFYSTSFSISILSILIISNNIMNEIEINKNINDNKILVENNNIEKTLSPNINHSEIIQQINEDIDINKISQIQNLKSIISSDKRIKYELSEEDRYIKFDIVFDKNQFKMIDTLHIIPMLNNEYISKKRNPFTVELHYHKGKILESLNKFKEAEKLYLELKETDSESLKYLGYLYLNGGNDFKLKNLDKSFKYFNKYLHFVKNEKEKTIINNMIKEVVHQKEINKKINQYRINKYWENGLKYIQYVIENENKKYLVNELKLFEKEYKNQKEEIETKIHEFKKNKDWQNGLVYINNTIIKFQISYLNDELKLFETEYKEQQRKEEIETKILEFKKNKDWQNGLEYIKYLIKMENRNYLIDHLSFFQSKDIEYKKEKRKIEHLTLVNQYKQERNWKDGIYYIEHLIKDRNIKYLTNELRFFQKEYNKELKNKQRIEIKTKINEFKKNKDWQNGLEYVKHILPNNNYLNNDYQFFLNKYYTKEQVTIINKLNQFKSSKNWKEGIYYIADIYEQEKNILEENNLLNFFIEEYIKSQKIEINNKLNQFKKDKNWNDAMFYIIDIYDYHLILQKKLDRNKFLVKSELYKKTINLVINDLVGNKNFNFLLNKYEELQNIEIQKEIDKLKKDKDFNGIISYIKNTDDYINYFKK